MKAPNQRSISPGEAGYAGGIVSAAIDGINCMKKIIEKNQFS